MPKTSSIKENKKKSAKQLMFDLSLVRDLVQLSYSSSHTLSCIRVFRFSTPPIMAGD